MNAILKFLKELSANNNREWFNANKDWYLIVKEEVQELTNKLIAEVGRFEPDASYLGIADCTYRIYRDTRFSSDKTPYKTHIGIFINPPYGKKSNRMGYYLHIEPSNCFAAAGTVCLPSKTVTAIRKSIFDNVEEYIEIIENPGFKAVFPKVGDNPVKTAPRNIPRDWKHLDLVRPKDFVTSHAISDKEMCSPDIALKVGEMFRIAKPFNDFINFTIDETAQD